MDYVGMLNVAQDRGNIFTGKEAEVIKKFSSIYCAIYNTMFFQLWETNSKSTSNIQAIVGSI